MWYDRIVTAVLTPDNVDAPQPVRERLDDIRPILVITRMIAAGWLLGVTVGALVGAVSWERCAAAVALILIIEWRVQWPASARTIDSLDRRLLVCALATLAWVATIQAVSDTPAWLWLMPYVFVLGAYAPALRSRSLAIMTAVAVVLLIGEVLSTQAGWLAVQPTAEPPWWVTVARAAIGIPIIAGLMAATPLRLRVTRAGLQVLAAALQRAERELSESHTQLQRWNDELHDAVRAQTRELEERNRQLAALNGVTSALAEDMEDERWLERSLAFIAQVIEASSVSCLVDAPRGEGITPQSITIAGDTSEVVPAWLMEDVVATGLPRYSGPHVGTHAGSAALPPRYAVIPLRAQGRSRGSLAAVVPGDKAWTESELQMLETIAADLATAIESRELYSVTVARARREAMLADVIELLDGGMKSTEAVRLALQRAGDLLGAMVMAVVVPRADTQPARIANRVVFEGRATMLRANSTAVDAALMAAPGLVSDRVHPLVFGAGGEVPVSGSMRDLGVQAWLICPLANPHGARGALVLLGDGSVHYGADEREMIERLARMLSHRIASDGLFQLQERRIVELSGLAQIADVIQSTSDVNRLLDGFARGMRQLCAYTDIFFARLDESNGDAVQISHYGADRHPIAQVVGGADLLLHPWFALRGAIPWSKIDGALPEFCASIEHPMLVVPLRLKGQVLGVVALATTTPPSAEEAALIAHAVGQLGLVLDSISLYRQATERAARIQVFGNLARIVASVVDVRDAFTGFVEEVRWLLPFDAAVMLRVDPARGIATPFAAYPEDHERSSQALPLADSALAAAAESRRILMVRVGDPQFSRHDWSMFGIDTLERRAGGAGAAGRGDSADSGSGEWAIVPILRGDVCTAVLVLAHSDRIPDTNDEITALEEVARLLAVSIERVDLFAQTEHSARHDLLTGLPNYRYLQERLREVQAGVSAPSSTSLLMVDMDDLKLFNDTLGHGAGDDAIQAVGRALRAVCRTEDFVARVGGDEFLAVLEGADAPTAVAITERLHDALRTAHLGIPNAPAAVRVSAGVASLPLDSETIEDLLQAADMAMYEAKFAGGGRTGVASELPATRHKRGFTGRPDRVVETVIRAVSASASLHERDAVALAQRYAVGTAIRLGVPPHDAELLRMLVARHAAPGLADARPGLDGILAARMLDGLATDWMSRDAESAAIGQMVVTAALDLAWLQLEAPAGAGYTLEAALQQIRRSASGALGATVRRELEVIAVAEAEQSEAGQRAA
ncbi:MAG: diguanylate cyclase [Chloroflexi bacterium]|nr:MAG: diguanylate cyclase [Chloroflexota bacterium]